MICNWQTIGSLFLIMNNEAKLARLNSGLSQAKAAELVYVCDRTWQNWEYGKTQIPMAYLELFLLKTGQIKIDQFFMIPSSSNIFCVLMIDSKCNKSLVSLSAPSLT